MTDGPCALCLRPLGRLCENHHLVPRSRGGRKVVEVHPICHRKIHAVFSEKELAEAFDTPARLRAHPEIARFLKWLDGKPPDFHKATRGGRDRGRRR